jgi:hypothetical protein
MPHGADLKLRTVCPLPVTIDQIDCAWLTAALRTRRPNVTVEDFEIVDINHGTCTKIRLRVDMDDVGKHSGIPPTVILKGGFEPHSRVMHGTHEKEVHGYRDVLEVLGLRSPSCYFAEYDAERQQGIVIMEDLVARGVHFCHPLVPQTHQQVATRLSVLAKFHSKTWGSSQFTGNGQWGWSADVMQAMRTYMTYYLQPEVWQRRCACDWL